jgi:hypothetical protein
LFAYAAYERLKLPLVGIDDASIYFVFAKNFAEGHGFVYNPGGERVEGFTSLLWTLIGAGAYRTGRIEIMLLLVLVSTLALALTMAVGFVPTTFTSPDRQPRGWTAAAAFLLLVYFMPAYIAWNGPRRAGGRQKVGGIYKPGSCRFVVSVAADAA